MISPEAWKVVTGETLVADSKGQERPATLLIYHWYRNWLRHVTKRPISRSGEPLTSQHQWWSNQHFAGRSMVDLAEELEPVALEAIGEAVDLYNPDKGPLIAWMKLILMQRLTAALGDWLQTSASQGDSQRRHLSLDLMLQGIDDGEQQETFVYTPQLVTFDDDPDDVTAIDRELVRVALEALDAGEREALELYANGNSYHAIARELGLFDATSARRVVQRARRKAQEAMMV
jgi:RNA polymerase sigma factor (sigma-70 family)